MKKTFRLSALLCAMTLLVTSCSKNILDEPVIDPALNGTEIQFGSRAGFENANPNTRTVYSGETYTGTNGADFERIDWVTGDQVTIYSPEAGGLNPAHYHVTKASVDENGTDVYDEGYLTKLMDGGLQWNTAETTHTFYAMYPSPLQLPTGIQNLVGLVGTIDPDTKDADVKINAYISNEQHSQGVVAYDANGKVVDMSAANAAASVKRYEVKPDMRFAYMAAKNTVDTGTADVTLDFVPVVTALRVELHLPTKDEVGGDSNTEITTIPDTYIGYVQLNCNGIAGAYTADLNDYVDGYPACENAGNAVNSIGMLINDNEGQPIKLTAGQSLFFTVFVRPGADINLKDIKLSFGLDPMTIKTKRLGTNDTTNVITSLKKTSITGLKLPYTVSAATLNYEKWMSQMKDETKISQLSILGTGGSFSYGYTGSNSSNFKQQTLPVFAERDANGNITKMGQWEMGVRAFEMACDRPSRSTVSSPGNLDKQPVRVNKQSMGSWTIGSALRALLDKVTSEEYSTETAMAIITYQSEGGYYNARHGYVFALALKNLYNTLITEQNGKYKDKIILYSPNTVLDGSSDETLNARGKLMIVCRVNQRDEGEPSDGNVNQANPTKLLGDGTSANPGTLYNWERAKTEFKNIPILLVNGCGTAKDRWKARGYQVSSDGISFASAWDILSDRSLSPMNAGTSVEYYIFNSRYYTQRVQTGGSASRPTYSIESQWVDHTVWNNVKKNPSQHNYETNADYNIWYQDWARVVDLNYIQSQGGAVDDNYYNRGSYPSVSSNSGWTDNKKYETGMSWRESYNEKLDDVKATFDKSISLNADDRKYVYINSLSGYLVDPAIEMSYTPFGYGSGGLDWGGGTQGNIQALAQKLNPAFGGYLRQVISAQGQRGATGVVLMDYLSSNPEDGASYFMPSVIISNNIYTGATDVIAPDDPDDDGGNDNENPGGGNTGGGDDGDGDWD